jgi:hypothetical protein
MIVQERARGAADAPAPRPGARPPETGTSRAVGRRMPIGWTLLVTANLLAQTAALEQTKPKVEPGPEPEAAATVEGLYPLWEYTGRTHASGTGQIGYGHAAWALGPVQLGTQPFLDLYGTLNLQAKAALVRGERTWLALQAGAYFIPTEAPNHTIGQLHAPRYDSYAPVTLVPIALAATWQPTPRARLHAATTLLVSRSPDPQHRNVSAGEALLAELLASPRWSARLHAGIEGVGVAAQAHAGLSFAYCARSLQLQAGYARTLPLRGSAGDGTIMFDGALLFR